LFEFEEKEYIEIVRQFYSIIGSNFVQMQEIAKVIGLVLESDFLIPLISGHVNEFVAKSSFKNAENLFVVLESILMKQTLEGIIRNITDIIGVFS